MSQADIKKTVPKIKKKNLRWFLGIALCIPTAHDFRVISVRT